jgi:hypothetical protein
VAGYTKLFSSILMSSIWEESAETRLVWVTMLALADQHGHVDGTVKSLARVSRVPIKACQKALDCLLGPDKDDRSGVMSGERIVAEQGGWRLVNHAAYRHRMSDDERRERDKIRKREARLSARRPQTSEFVRDVSQAEAEAEAKEEATTTKSAPVVVARPPALLMSSAHYVKKRETHRHVGTRLHVPNVLHAEFVTKLGGDDPDATLVAWYATLDAELEASKEPVPDVFLWLRPRFVAWASQSTAEAAMAKWVAGQ